MVWIWNQKQLVFQLNHPSLQQTQNQKSFLSYKCLQRIIIIIIIIISYLISLKIISFR